jgi:hypothetical protein
MVGSTKISRNVFWTYQINLLQVSLPGQWFFPGITAFSTNKTDCHDVCEILLKVALNTLNQTKGRQLDTNYNYRYLIL